MLLIDKVGYDIVYVKNFIKEKKIKQTLRKMCLYKRKKQA